MRALALAVLLCPPAAAAKPLTDAQLAAKVRTERGQYDNAMNALQKRQEKLNDANARLNDLRGEKEDGTKRDKVGGVPCQIDGCIGKQQKAVARQEKLLASATAEARKQAQQYIDQENAYAARTGHPLDPTTFADADTFVNGTRGVGGTGGTGTTPTTDGGIGTPPGSGGGCGKQYGTCIPDIGTGTDDPDSPTGRPPDYRPPTPDELAKGGAPGSRVGDLGTGHEAQDLAQFAQKGAAGDSMSFNPRGLSGGERVALHGGVSASFDPSAVRADIMRGAGADAQAAIQDALRRDPRNFQARLLDAEAKNAVGDWGGAEQAARQAIALNPSDPRSYKALAVSLLHQGRNEEALEAAAKAADLDPDDADAQMLKAFAYEGLGRKAEMMASVERAAELDPGRFSSYLKLARLGKVLFDRRRTMKGWHGIPVPAPGSDDSVPAAPGAGASAATAGGNGRMVLLGLGLLLAALGVLAGAAWRKRSANPFNLKR